MSEMAVEDDSHDGLVYDPESDEWYPPDQFPKYHDCPLCGDAGWPEGVECRQVKKAREEGRL